MSTPFVFFSKKTFVSIYLFLLVISAGGQVRESPVRIDLGKLPVVSVEIRTLNRRHLSFLRSIAGVDRLSERISHLEVRDGPKTVALKWLADGEYISDSDFDTVSYDLDLSPMKSRSAT